jgi:hypothetical protein
MKKVISAVIQDRTNMMPMQSTDPNKDTHLL